MNIFRIVIVIALTPCQPSTPCMVSGKCTLASRELFWPGRIKDSLCKVASRSTCIFTLCVQAQSLASDCMRRSHHQAGVSMTIRCKITRRLDVCLVHCWRSSFTGLKVAFLNLTKHTPGSCTVHVCPLEKATWPSNGIAVRWKVVRAGGLCAWHGLREGKGDSLFPRSSIPRHIFLLLRERERERERDRDCHTNLFLRILFFSSFNLHL
jgi:hypothetical protein